MKIVSILIATGLAAAIAEAAEFETGGPLAGLKLPVSPQNTGPGPEVELWPGSVEHWRGYMMKYVPMRSFFDAQSQLKLWNAKQLAGKTEMYSSPVYKQPDNGDATDTGQRLPAVPVVRCGVGAPVFKLDLGELDRGLYAVRVIGAVETAKLRRFREPLFLRMTINDGLNGETNKYRIRCGYVDEFYNVGTFYFHSFGKRKFTAEIAVDAGSTVELLVPTVTLDDVLAGTVRRPLKTKGTLTSLPPDDFEEEGDAPAAKEKKVGKRKQFAALKPAERLERDALLWDWMPPLNAQGAAVGGPRSWEPAEPGVADKTEEQIAAEFGAWENAGHPEMLNLEAGILPRDAKLARAFLVNKKLGLEYTLDDLRAGKPLPDPFPYKDTGAGLYFPDPTNPAKGRVFAPIATAVGRRYRHLSEGAKPYLKMWQETRNTDFARDAAVTLIRYALQFPTIEYGDFLNNVTCIPQAQNRDYACRQREGYAFWMTGYPKYDQAILHYDELFDYIKGNEDLAQSVGRFVPWVKTSADLIELLDVYLVQTTAKRILRYHYITGPTKITDLAIALGDPTVTAPWMDWQFSRTFIYPLKPAGIQDLMVSGCDREGLQYIGSTFYAQGEGAIRLVEPIERYVAAGGDPKFWMFDPATYPKPRANVEWQLNNIIAGADFARIGDVAGPDKSPFATITKALEARARDGWRWTSDPRWAWLIKHIFGRDRESREEWKKINEAARQVQRAPWLDLPSRHVDNWFGVLETGHQHDDYRFRRAVYVRTGLGHGHAHEDALDLQIVAHGVPMTVDGGQRSGYSKPNDKFTRVHNTVDVGEGEADDFGFSAYGYLTALTDAPGARYLQATTERLPAKTKLFRRQVALVDVDEGRGSQPLTPEQQKPWAKLPGDVTTAHSYVVDVFRVSGAGPHTYCFHGPVNDDFHWNATDVHPAPDEPYLKPFQKSVETKAAGRAPNVFQATWRYLRKEGGRQTGGAPGSEQQMLRANFDPNSPRKFTRLTVLGAGDARALKADVVCFKKPIEYQFTQTMLQRTTAKGTLESAFVAVIEPYVGEPFLTAQRLVPVANNEPDARRAVAVEVETKNGHKDLTFADGRPEKLRQVGAHKIAGEFAFHSTDAQGLRHATLTGGTQLESPAIRLSLPAREATAKIVKVDYRSKTFWTDKPLPANAAGRVIEFGAPGRPTSYTIASIEGTRVTVTRGADFYRAQIEGITSDPLEVTGALSLPEGRNKVVGMTLSNDDASKTWRIVENRNRRFTPDGPVTASDFAPANVVRVWEYGVGDTVRLPAYVSVRRIAPGVFEVNGDSDATLAFPGQSAEISSDQKRWQPFTGAPIRAGTMYVRLAK